MFGMRLWEWHSSNCERVAEPNPTGIVPSIIAMITEIRSSAATGDNHDPHTKVKVWGSWFWALYQFIRNRANPKTPHGGENPLHYTDPCRPVNPKTPPPARQTPPNPVGLGGVWRFGHSGSVVKKSDSQEPSRGGTCVWLGCSQTFSVVGVARMLSMRSMY